MRHALRAAIVGVLALSLAAPAHAGRAAYFLVDYPPGSETFVIKLRDPAKIAHARRVLLGEETEAVHVSGRVRRRTVRWNRPWHFVLAPKSIEFFAFAVEACDASIAYVEEHLAEVGGAFLPGSRWCPWGLRLLREVSRPGRTASARLWSPPRSRGRPFFGPLPALWVGHPALTFAKAPSPPYYRRSAVVA